MHKRTLWRKVPARSIDRASCGRTSRAYRRPGGGLLLLHRPRSRNAKGHQRINVWSVALDGTLVRRRTTYGRRVSAPPIPWANRMIAEFSRANGAACPLVNGARPTLRQSIESAPVHYDELPTSLVQPSSGHGRGEADALDGVDVPMRLPTVPMRRTVNGPFARAVLSRDEYDLFAETWRSWTAQHPYYADPPCRESLETICLETVLMFRLQQLGLVESPRVAKLYHASYNRQHRAREALGALRRQGWRGLSHMNIAVIVGRLPDPGPAAAARPFGWYGGWLGSHWSPVDFHDRSNECDRRPDPPRSERASAP